MSWTRIDLGPEGKAGIEARYRDAHGKRFVYLAGSDHWIDWVHHVVPFAGWRERRAGRMVARLMFDPAIKRYVVGGHSLGGAVACVVAQRLREKGVDVVEAYVFGGKPAPLFVSTDKILSIRVRGDIVPELWLPRPRYRSEMLVDHGPLGFVEAHEPRQYHESMSLLGLK